MPHQPYHLWIEFDLVKVHTKIVGNSTTRTSAPPRQLPPCRQYRRIQSHQIRRDM